jgi:putative transposase
MGRIARVVIPGCWHHVTQRGNRCQNIFLDDTDRKLYLDLLRGACDKYHVAITGYCLMSNHVHILAVPKHETGLAQALGRTHNDYARWHNVRRSQTGHLWQNRYYSCPMDDIHQWEALRYVELNPVRAGMVRRAEEWPWSSARAHVLGCDHRDFLSIDDWADRWSTQRWRESLEVGISDATALERIREATRTGRPAGDATFVEDVEVRTGRRLRPAKRGPKESTALVEGQLSFEVV